MRGGRRIQGRKGRIRSRPARPGLGATARRRPVAGVPGKAFDRPRRTRRRGAPRPSRNPSANTTAVCERCRAGGVFASTSAAYKGRQTLLEAKIEPLLPYRPYAFPPGRSQPAGVRAPYAPVAHTEGLLDEPSSRARSNRPSSAPRARTGDPRAPSAPPGRGAEEMVTGLTRAAVAVAARPAPHRARLFRMTGMWPKVGRGPTAGSAASADCADE